MPKFESVLRQMEKLKVIVRQARRQGGFEGVRANPPFDLQKILYTPLNCTFY